MELTVTYLGGVQFEAEARGHKVYSDQPLSNHGYDEGMTPPEFLLAAVGTCAGYYAAEYLNTHNLPAAGLRITVTAEKALRPARLARFTVTVATPGVHDAEHQTGVKQAVEKCLVKNTLQVPSEITVDVVSEVVVGA